MDKELHGHGDCSNFEAMRFALVTLVFGCCGAFAAQPPLEVDPNTKIHGGADPRGSGAAAGAGMRRDNKMDTEPRVDPPGNNVPRPDKTEADKDKPFAERKPRDDDRQYPGKEPAVPRR
jgi:hypothetical protein